MSLLVQPEPAGPARVVAGPARAAAGLVRAPAVPARVAAGPARAAAGLARAPADPARAAAGPARVAAGPARVAAGPAWAAVGPARVATDPARAATGPARVAAYRYLTIYYEITEFWYLFSNKYILKKIPAQNSFGWGKIGHFMPFGRATAIKCPLDPPVMLITYRLQLEQACALVLDNATLRVTSIGLFSTHSIHESSLYYDSIMTQISWVRNQSDKK